VFELTKQRTLEKRGMGVYNLIWNSGGAEHGVEKEVIYNLLETLDTKFMSLAKLI
jgi:hypothetical protein